MALQAPQYNGPRMGQASFVPADANDFGAAEARQAGRLARQGLHASLDVLAAAQEQQRKCDTAVVKNATNQARIEMLDGMEKIKAERGANAQNAREEANALFESVNRKYGTSIAGGNIERQEMYNNSMRSMKSSYELTAARHQARQMQQFEMDSITLENKALYRELDAIWRGNSPISSDADQEVIVDENGQTLPPVNPGEETAKRILRIRENIAMQLAGSPAGYIKQVQDDEEVRMHSIVLNALADNNPRSALEYLQQPEVQGIMPPKEWAKAHEWLNGVVKTADITEDAVASVDGMTPADILRKGYEDPRYKNDPAARKQFMAITADIAKQRDALAKAEQAGQKQKLWDAFEGSGYQTIPPEAMKDWTIYEPMLDAQAKVKKVADAGAIPDEEFLIDLFNKTPEQKREFLSDGANYAQFLLKSSGDKAWRSAILDSMDEAKSGNAGAAGRNGVYGGMNLSEQIEANFPSLAYTATEKGILWDSETVVGGTEYDGTDSEHKRMKANFMHHFRNRWNDAELYKDAPPNERAENILFDIIGEYRDQKLELTAPIYDTAMAERMQGEIDNPVVESLNPETGKTEVTLHDAGEVKTFEKIDPAVFNGIVSGITVDSGFRVPEAAQAGAYKGVAYQPGDTILISRDKLHKMNESIVVLDSELNLRTGSVSIGLSAATGATISQAAEQQHAEPPKTDKMRVWEKKNGVKFEWQEYTGRFLASMPDPNSREGKLWYQAFPNGEISYIGGNPDSDAEALLELGLAGEYILDQIEDLEDMVAGYDESVPWQKSNADRIRAQIEELRTEYKKTPEGAARESGFYVG